MLTNNFSDSSFLSKDDAYQFMGTIKGTPAYWKKFLYEVLAIIKQLGLPKFFMTLTKIQLRPSTLNLELVETSRGCMITPLYHK